MPRPAGPANPQPPPAGGLTGAAPPPPPPQGGLTGAVRPPHERAGSRRPTVAKRLFNSYLREDKIKQSLFRTNTVFAGRFGMTWGGKSATAISVRGPHGCYQCHPLPQHGLAKCCYLEAVGALILFSKLMWEGGDFCSVGNMGWVVGVFFLKAGLRVWHFLGMRCSHLPHSQGTAAGAGGG